jgi:hypothetical protein
VTYKEVLTMVSMRVDAKAACEVDKAVGTSRFVPVPRFGTIILYGTSYAGGRVSALFGKLPSSCTWNCPPPTGTAYLPVMCMSSHQCA